MDIVAALRHKDQLPLQLQRVEDAAAVMWRLSSIAADEIERLRAELAECRLAMSCVRDLSEIVRMPNVEHVADAHNAAVKRLRAALAAKE